ncbi:Rpn family recombination-promoting nuclease/putative transposase [Chitinimonas arctica]|uniref:Rpn family recombination-promoting nuclease/putative transposase n=1 Tax=Chitinimonas arctica TaxID=2594795 RepID=A0A516SAD2_9NEIS|nr:Rpn family recombination-promoting nuclease/putative transposase [Chitinimonas arctica]QDQ25102.1 Rpn family recombination-promoting nuclease/putative transposase [Chitinimonas arctica]
MSPYDALFEQFEITPTKARDFLEAHLPPVVREQIDLDTLHLEPSSHLDPGMRVYYSDTLYSAKTVGQDGYKSLLIYIMKEEGNDIPEVLLKTLARGSPQCEELVMPLIQMVEQRGEKRGLKLGEQRGMERGIELGRTEYWQKMKQVARAMVANGMDKATVMQITRVGELAFKE